MAEVLVVGKKISEMELVTGISGNEKIPTGVVGDKAVTTGQLVEYLNDNGRSVWGRIDGDITNQVDLQNQFTQERNDLKSYTQEQVYQQQVALQEHIDVTNEAFKYASDNGSALPYKVGISYEEGAVVVKDGLLQQLKGGVWKSAVAEGLSDTIQTFSTTEAGVDPVIGVADGAYFNVRSTDDDTMLVEYQNIGGVATPSGKSYPSASYVQNVAKHTALPFVDGKAYSLNERVQLENGDIVKNTINGNTADPNVDMSGWVEAILKTYVNILDYGAKPFINDPASAYNSYTNISGAIDDVVDGGTLYIPSGKFLFNGAKKGITDKNINIICDGELYIDATLINFGFNFRNTPTTVSGSSLSAAPKKGDLALSFSTVPSIQNPQNYFVHIKSTEPVHAVPLTGGVQHYYKLQNINILGNDYALMFPSLYDYSDKNSITLDFYPMRTNTKVQLKIMLYNTNSEMNIGGGVIRTQGYSNCDFNYSIKKLESSPYFHGIGFYAEYSNSLRFPNPSCSIFSRDPANPTRGYNFLNSQSTLLFFSETSQRKIAQSGFYVARHGRYVYFDKVSFSIDDHFGHDYFLNNCPLPSGVTFAGGSLTLKDCSNLTGYLVSLRGDTPFAEGTLLIENCKPARGYLFTSRGTLPTYEGFTNPAKTWDEIIIKSASSAKVTSEDCNMQINGILDGYAFEQTKLLKIDANFEVENAYSGAFAAIIDGKFAPVRSHFKKIILNNVNYSVAGTQTVTGGNMPLRNIAADTIELNNCFGLAFAGCRADNVFINGGSYGVPANAMVQTWLTDIKQLNAATVNIFINGTAMSNNARLYTLTADRPSVSKAYYISDSVLNSSLISTVNEADYVQKATDNCGYSGQSTWLSFDIKNYYKDDVRGERYAKVSTTVPSLTAGASSSVFTATFNRGRANMFESVVGSFNVDSKGLRIVAWVSANDTISYYFENPTGNPNGAVTLGAVNILFKTV